MPQTKTDGKLTPPRQSFEHLNLLYSHNDKR